MIRICLAISLWNTLVAWFNISILHTVHLDGTLCRDHHQFLPIVIPLTIALYIALRYVSNAVSTYILERNI